MTDASLIMVAGLGNPGEKYSRTRHNIGFLVIEELARRYSMPLKQSRFDADFSKGRISDRAVVLVKPLSYMNRSGIPIQRLSSFFKINSSELIVIHDDLDLEFGRIRIAANRGHGGHNGIRSIVEAFGSRDFIRIRIGVGRPSSQEGVVGHVLGMFSPEEFNALDALVDKCADACLVILDKGVIRAMDLYNSNN